MPRRPILAAAVGAALAGTVPLAAQSPPALDRVLAFPAAVSGEALQADRGAAGAWHRIRKLATTASILHVTAHPDDEHSGMLTLASRGWGARTALLSLNRGEAGANAIGPELFDALGLIRTRELVLAGRYYGLDDLYFTTAVDYGYSKSVDEAFRSWDREAVLEDMVRVIRLNRPVVVVSRWHGTPRDGHGHHHAAGLLTPEAVAAAADPGRFPGQIADEGLRAWRVPRLYRGGVREGELHHVAVEAGAYSPSLGMTYQRWASLGLSLQRSQTSGRVRSGGGQVYRYEMLPGAGAGANREENPGVVRRNRAEMADNFFAGLDTRLTGLHALVGEEAGAGVAGALAELQAVIDGVVRDFDFLSPGASLPGLVRGLALVRAVTGGAAVTPEARFHLAVKERQFEDAIVAAAGVEVQAVLDGEAGGAAVVPGEVAGVAVSVESAMPGRVEVVAARLLNRAGVALAGSAMEPPAGVPALATRLEARIPPGTDVAGPYFGRDGLAGSHYQVSDSAGLHLPWRRAALVAEVTLHVDGAEIAGTVPVTASVPRLPYGSVARRVEVLPALAVSVTPAVRVLPGSGTGGPGVAEVLVRVEANTADVSAEVSLELPAGWTATPASFRNDFRGRGEVADTRVAIHPPAEWSGGEAVVQAVARGTAHGHAGEYRSGFQTIDQRDLPLARLRIAARTTIRSVAAASLDGLVVGYVMGVGDEVPAAIDALGASVRLLGGAELAGGELGAFDAIIVGTRAYAVRRDLVENNQRLMDYARGGGNLVVLYQTQEFVPSAMAPYPATLPRGAEEVSEEDAPVRLLAPSHPLLASPNRITEADFDGWLEQRGSKFFAEWDPAYTAMLETHDTGQAPQRGIWLAADVGDGHYSYLALALHRQLPYGVPGAYRILSNVISR